MRNDQHLAVKLRKKGKSYNQISRELGIPKSTMHYWFSSAGWSDAIKKRLTARAKRLATKQMRIIGKAQQQRWQQWREAHRREAVKEFPKLKTSPLFIAGVALYWGEGDHGRGGSIVRLVNTDPRMIRLFSKFLKKICHVPTNKIHPAIFLYPDLNENICKIYWSRASSIPQLQFQKTQFIQGRHPTKRTQYGMCALCVYSQGLKEKLFTWEDLCFKYLKR